MKAASLRSVQDSNAVVEFALEALQKQLHLAGQVVLAFPEDLGKRACGATPASVWSWPQAQRLLKVDGVRWGALCQSDWGKAYREPTRLLARIPGFEEIVHVGDPVFDDQGYYRGPLPADGERRRGLVGKVETCFRTRSSAAWPTRLCEKLAEKVFEGKFTEANEILATGGLW